MGIESEMNFFFIYEDDNYIGIGKLKGKVVLVIGGDSGIGWVVFIVYVKEGVDVVIVYLNEYSDVEEIKVCIEEEGVRCLLIVGDVGDELFCNEVVEKIVSEFGKFDIFVNNVGE